MSEFSEITIRQKWIFLKIFSSPFWSSNTLMLYHVSHVRYKEVSEEISSEESSNEEIYS